MTGDGRYPVDSDPTPDAEWELWYEDTFDTECPRQVEAAGTGLAAGLAQLWARHLFETVGVDGVKGFSRFNLWWKQERASIDVAGPQHGLVRLRTWIFGNKRRTSRKNLEQQNERLLENLAVAHVRLILAGRTGEEIVAVAADCASRDEFEGYLLSSAEDDSFTELGQYARNHGQ